MALFTGCATALITPFKEGAVDYKAFEALVEEQIAAGVDALVVAGTTGEPATMGMEEHEAVIRFVVNQTAGRVPVIAGAGGNATSEAIELAQRAKNAGADAQLCVTPYYNKTSQAGLVANYHAIANATDLPIIVYNVPSRTGLNITPATLEKIVAHPNVVAVKEANPDVAQAAEKIRRCGDKVDFYSGNDDLIVPLMALGFKGVISVLSNPMPKETVAMTKAALAGDFATAGREQLRLLPFINSLFLETNPIPVKAAMALMGKCEDELRLPLVPMQEEPR